MPESCAEIDSLDSLDRKILNCQGWCLITYLHVRGGADGFTTFNYVVDMVQKHNLRVAIRAIIKGGIMYKDIWGYWNYVRTFYQ